MKTEQKAALIKTEFRSATLVITFWQSLYFC